MYPTMLPFDVVLPNEPLALDLTRLYQRLHTLPDQRARRGVRYPLPMLLLIAILAKLTGQDHVRAIAEWAALRADELACLFHFPRTTMPHPVTWSRIFGTAVDVTALEHLLRDTIYPSDGEVPTRASVALALDGKTLRGAIPLGQTQGVHLRAAYLPTDGVARSGRERQRDRDCADGRSAPRSRGRRSDGRRHVYAADAEHADCGVGRGLSMGGER